MVLELSVVPVPVVVVVLVPVSVPVVLLVPVSVPVVLLVPVSVPVSPVVSVSVPVDVAQLVFQVLSPETVYEALCESSESLESNVVVHVVALDVGIASVVTELLAEDELEDVVFTSAVSPDFDSLQAVSATPRVSPRVASTPGRTVPHGAWQKGQVVVSANT